MIRPDAVACRRGAPAGWRLAAAALPPPPPACPQGTVSATVHEEQPASSQLGLHWDTWLLPSVLRSACSRTLRHCRESESAHSLARGSAAHHSYCPAALPMRPAPGPIRHLLAPWALAALAVLAVTAAGQLYGLSPDNGHGESTAAQGRTLLAGDPDGLPCSDLVDTDHPEGTLGARGLSLLEQHGLNVGQTVHRLRRPPEQSGVKRRTCRPLLCGLQPTPSSKNTTEAQGVSTFAARSSTTQTLK